MALITKFKELKGEKPDGLIIKTNTDGPEGQRNEAVTAILEG
jgi:hypothetical protein